MIFPDDPRLRAVLTAFGVAPSDLLGHGGEAWVYALDEHRVVRVLHEGQTGEVVRRRQALVDELRAGSAPFDLPEVLDVGEIDGRWYAIERRLAGRSVLDRLGGLDGRERDLLVEAHLEAAASLGALRLCPRRWYGDLMDDDPVRTQTWKEFLVERAARNLRRSTPDFAHVRAAALADALPDTDQPRFVHLDAFAGNMLAVGSSVTAVLDIGLTSVSGDARLDPVSAVVYLTAPPITPVASRRDADVAMSWLRSKELADLFVPARRWLAAFWSFAVDDTTLHEWCRSVLVPPA